MRTIAVSNSGSRVASFELSISAALVLLLLLIAAPRAHAEPYIAVREGLACSACHVNMNGGGKRTALVETHARQLLHYPKQLPGPLGPLSKPPEYFTGDINQYLGLGADLRTSYVARFQDDPDRNGRVDNNQAFRGRLESNDIEVDPFVYTEVRLIPEYLTFYADLDLSDNVDDREVFGMLRGVLPWNGYVKAGRMFLPYGLQLQDDAAFIRQETYNFDTREAAFELGFEPGPFVFMAAVSEGGSGDRDVRVTTTAYAMLTRLPVVRSAMIGNSFSRVGTSNGDRVLFGFFGGTNLERFTLLLEGDWIDNAGKGLFAGYVEADYLFFDWLNFKVAFDYADSDSSRSAISDDSKNRVSFGFEPFLNRFLQLRLFYRIANGVESIPARNQNQLLAEVHLFF
jgi:hypothetical protein